MIKKTTETGFNWKPILYGWYWRILAKNPWRKCQCRRLYIFPCGSTKWCRITCSVQNSIPNINIHRRQKASTVRLLVPVTLLHSVCGLYTVRRNGTNSLSFSAAAPLLYMALQWCHWEHLAQLPSFKKNYIYLILFIFFFKHMVLCSGAHYSTEIQRVITSD